ncbi:sorbitol dehydrogenase [Elysia marginata]|uniref:Sorbitol dehydrogenase n=1 Tax=Elysia marginata TaxID=1093978 RepID=A0AAV4HH02_9GAST|nr:sorbitol dehydrogenase [Elysia marginata]
MLISLQEDLPIPEPKENWVQLRMSTVGLCRTDVHLYDEGKLDHIVINKPLTIGHEISGTVSKLGAGVTGLTIDEVCFAANIHARMKTVYGEMCILECKAKLMEYSHKPSPSPKKLKVDASARKVLSTVFWDMEGVVHMKFLEQGQTVNSERYISTLRALIPRLRHVLRYQDSILQHNNACPNTSPQSEEALKVPALWLILHFNSVSRLFVYAHDNKSVTSAHTQ